MADGVHAAELPLQRLDATYYDTPDLQLARNGITVRFRTGEGAKGKWTVKLPEGDRGPSLVRREIDVVASGRTVPKDVAALVRAHVRSASLGPVGVLRTCRRRIEVRSVSGSALLEVADDDVSVLDGRTVARRFREVEVEVRDADGERLLPRVVDVLVAAGAEEADQTPKIVQALGSRALAPPDVTPAVLDRSAALVDVVRAAIAGGVVRLLRHDPGVRLGDDPEDVHQARVGARRLRSDLRTFRSVLDVEAARPLLDELRWLGVELGHVRDADVLQDRLRVQAAGLPATDQRAATALLRRLDGERTAAREALLVALDSDRYLRLLDALFDGADRPPVTSKADVAARKALPGIARGPWKHLQKAVQSLDGHSEDDALHEIRIRAKRARYAAEAAAPVLGPRAARFAKAVAGVQTVLGDLQDAVVAEQWLRGAAAKGPAAPAMVAGQLIAVQREAMAASRRDWHQAWDRAAAKKLRAWLA